MARSSLSSFVFCCKMLNFAICKKVINYDENSSSVKVNLTLNSNEDYCTMIESSSIDRQLFQIVSHRCDSQETNVYPLCRLQRNYKCVQLLLLFQLLFNFV